MVDDLRIPFGHALKGSKRYQDAKKKMDGVGLVVGHSLGGAVAAALAEEDPKLRGRTYNAPVSPVTQGRVETFRHFFDPVSFPSWLSKSNFKIGSDFYNVHSYKGFPEKYSEWAPQLVTDVMLKRPPTPYPRIRRKRIPSVYIPPTPASLVPIVEHSGEQFFDARSAGSPSASGTPGWERALNFAARYVPGWISPTRVQRGRSTSPGLRVRARSPSVQLVLDSQVNPWTRERRGRSRSPQPQAHVLLDSQTSNIPGPAEWDLLQTPPSPVAVSPIVERLVHTRALSQGPLSQVSSMEPVTERYAFMSIPERLAMLGPRANSIRRRYRHRSIPAITYLQRQALEDWEPAQEPPHLDMVVYRRLRPHTDVDAEALREAISIPFPEDDVPIDEVPAIDLVPNMAGDALQLVD